LQFNIDYQKKNRYTELEDAVNEWEHGLRHISVGLVDGNNLSLNPYFSESSEAQRLLTLVSKAIDLLDHVEADPMPVESLNQLYGTDIATESGKIPKQVIRDAFDIVNVLVNK